MLYLYVNRTAPIKLESYLTLLKPPGVGFRLMTLFSGPKMQTDLTVIITRWRFFPVVFTADIVKMFRQFLMHQDHRDWLRILWRDHEDLRIYRMRTVIYGTTCAPYQAIRTFR